MIKNRILDHKPVQVDDDRILSINSSSKSRHGKVKTRIRIYLPLKKRKKKKKVYEMCYTVMKLLYAKAHVVCTQNSYDDFCNMLTLINKYKFSETKLINN